MRVLFYGGCHAVALCNLFRRHAKGTHQFEAIENYKIIEAGTPFPYDEAASFDAVAYSPIVNKGDWNTIHLQSQLEGKTKLIRFPWLQWNGYFPDVVHVDAEPHSWGFRPIMREIKWISTPETILRLSTDGLESNARAYFEEATEELRKKETGADAKILDFILANYQAKRLFLTPDHPTRTLYAEVARQIGALLDIAITVPARGRELHIDKLPILPAVAKGLGLLWEDSTYATDSGEKGDLPAYLDSFRRAYEAIAWKMKPEDREAFYKQDDAEFAMAMEAERKVYLARQD